MAILHERDQLETWWSRRRVTHSVGLLVVKAVDVVRPRQNIITSLTKALDDWVVECLIGYMDLQRVFDARVSYLRVESKTLVYQKIYTQSTDLNRRCISPQGDVFFDRGALLALTISDLVASSEHVLVGRFGKSPLHAMSGSSTEARPETAIKGQDDIESNGGEYDVLVECSGDRETRYRAEFMWFGEYRHHNFGGFVCTRMVVHEVARGEVHQVVIGKEDGHVIGGDAQVGGVGIGIGHADKQAKLGLDKLIKLVVRQHVIANMATKVSLNAQAWTNRKTNLANHSLVSRVIWRSSGWVFNSKPSMAPRISGRRRVRIVGAALRSRRAKR